MLVVCCSLVVAAGCALCGVVFCYSLVVVCLRFVVCCARRVC